MQSSFRPAPFNPDFFGQSSFYFIGDNGGRINQSCFGDLEEFHQSDAGVNYDDAVDLSPSSMFSSRPRNVSVATDNLHYSTTYDAGMGCGGREGEEGCLDTGQFVFQKRTTIGALGTSVSGHNNSSGIENWCDSVSAMADNSQHTDTSTDIDTDDKTQLHGVKQGAYLAIESTDQSKVKCGDQKTLRRLAQNREAARKSRMRKKAYVQQLESSRIRLTQIEEELRSARQQGFYAASGVSDLGDKTYQVTGNGSFAFDLEYTRWLDEHQQLINELRSAVNSHVGDKELRLLVDGVMTHYDEIFRLKSVGSKADIFHMISGIWKTPAERFFMWLGGFRSSELLKILGNHLDPLTDQQLIGICNLQQSSQQAEDALSQGMEALQQSLLETLSSSWLGPTSSANVVDYMGQMAIAMGKLATLENFLRQADLLRQQTLQQLHRILTTRQAARAFLVIHDYLSRLRALSSLWLARPRD